MHTLAPSTKPMFRSALGSQPVLRGDILIMIIINNLVQFFYKDFSHKTNDRLDAFDKDYGKHLQDEHRRQKKVC